MAAVRLSLFEPFYNHPKGVFKPLFFFLGFFQFSEPSESFNELNLALEKVPFLVVSEPNAIT